MAVRPFRLYGEASLRALAAAFAQPVREWAGAWGLKADTAVVHCAPAMAANTPQARWRERWSSDGCSAWCDWEPGLLGQIQECMFASVDSEYLPRASLAPAAAEAALDALLSAVRTLGGEAPPAVGVLQPAPDWAGAYGSGFVLVSVAVGNNQLRLLLDGAWAAALLVGSTAKAAPLPRLQAVALGKCIDAMPIALNVVAGHVELGAGSLLGLRPGDVLRLGTAADAAFSISMPSGKHLAMGFIGRQDGTLAVEIAASTNQH